MSSATSVPALLGGPAVRPQGPPSWPQPDAAVLRALEAAFHDGSWGRYHGGNADRLERRLCDQFQVGHALLCGSGTFAVELALRSLRVEPGDEVLLAAYDYGGNFLCVHALGAHPVLVDVDPRNWNMSLQCLAAGLGPGVRALVVSHLHGGLVPMRQVMELAAAHGVGVVEDAAQQPGAFVQGRPAGTWGDIGVLSFGGSKLLTAGRGGALLTNRPDVYQRARRWQLRGNLLCPLSELQAAVLLPQLDRLDECNSVRGSNVAWLCEQLRAVPGLRPFANVADVGSPACYKLGFQYDAEAFGLPRERFVAALRAEGVAFDKGFHGLHVGRSEKRYRAAGPLTESERAHHGVVVLHHPILQGSAADLAEVVDAVHKIHSWAQGGA
jgi:dTDP-4-amino-4,6-dideoxygalactose transaminase